MIKKASLALLVFLSLTSISWAKFLTLNEIGQASCRVNASIARGSGTAISSDGQYVYVLTNAHVVGDSTNVTCEFFRYGRKTRALPGEVIWKAYSERSVLDFAIIRMGRSLFGSMPPRIVPIAPPSHAVSINDYICSAGCPQARWLQLWEGHALSKSSRDQVLFTPPPLGGQSGSGVYTVIKGHTYLVGILTWRIDQDKGGAIHLSNFIKAIRGETATQGFLEVPSSWEHPLSGSSKKEKAQTKRAYYALAANGYYFLQDFINGRQYQRVTLGPGMERFNGIKMIKWNILLEVDCPFGICPPFLPPKKSPKPTPPPDITLPPDGNPGGNGDGDNPFGEFPPNIDPNPKDPVIELTKQIALLQAKIESLESSASSLLAEKDSLSSQIGELKSAVATKEKLIEKMTSDGAGYTSKIDSLKSDITDHLSKINDLSGSLQNKQSELEGIAGQLGQSRSDISVLEEAQSKALGENGKLSQEVEEVKSERNLLGWLFGGTSTSAILAWILSFYWKKRGKKKLRGLVDGAEERVEEYVDPDSISDKINDRIDAVEDRVLGDNNRLEGVVDFLQDKLGDVIEGRIDGAVNTMHEKIDSLQDSVEHTIENKIEGLKKDSESQRRPVIESPATRETIENVSYSPPPNKKVVDEECECECGDSILDHIRSNHSFPCVSERIRQFIDLKSQDGEKIEELAFYAQLYKEAVGHMKTNTLIIDKQGKLFKVNGQPRAAAAIESYVKKEFLRRISATAIDAHYMYHEAMIGFLYKEAIARLRRGEFNVLGYKDIAECIENWVRTEFLQRMGFQF